MTIARTKKVEKGIRAFFDYSIARHKSYLYKYSGDADIMPTDDILRDYSFCNVFRELDKTTMWYANNVRRPLDTDKERPDKLLLATVLFRMFNRIETGEAFFRDDNLLGDHSAFDEYWRTGSTKHLRKAALARIGKKGPFVTGSYIIAGPKGMSKLDGMLKVVDNFRRSKAPWPGKSEEYGFIDAPKVMRARGSGLQHAHQWLREFDYMGTFHAYEIVTDLRWTHLLSRSPDVFTWANPGPGCKRGLNRVYGREKDEPWGGTEAILEHMDVLREASEEYWTDFAHRAKDRYPKLKTPLEWEMRDIEHTLCEFDKYERTRAGEGRPRGRYRGHEKRS
jgi:hypothetical protein